jgi:stalled ribosome rescue protein Dom34
MTINAGVWIDHHKAVVVLITDDGEDIRQILSDVKKNAHSAGGVRVKNSYTRNDFVAEDKLERKAENHLKEFYDKVISHLSDADTIFILGPGEAKGELKKRIQRKRLRGQIAKVETVDKMTDAQIVEHVRDLFCAGIRIQ